MILNNNESNWKCYTFISNYKTTTQMQPFYNHLGSIRAARETDLMNILKAYH